ncbi:MAG: MATE family efflux transporter [Pseudomonadota bacterium]
MLSNVTVPLLGMVDTFVVGQLGEAAPIAAVGLASAVISLIYWMFGFLRMGTSGLVAQAKGAGEAAETGALLMRGLVVGVGAGLVFVVLQGLIVWLAVVASPAEPEVEAMAAAYLSVRLWGAPFAISIYALTGWLIGMERTRGVLTLQLCMNGLNAALSLLFVLGFGWGVEGVAAATVIAEVVGAALGLLLCREAFAGDQWRDLERVLDRAKIRRMAEVNRDILIRSALLETGFLYFIFVASPFFGTAVLAANHVLFKFIEVTAFALDGFAFAAETLAGQAFGARRPATVRRAAVMSSLWGLGMTGAISALFLLAGPMIIDLIAVAPDVREEARRYLPWIAAIPVLSLPAFMFDGVFVGATRTRDMRDSMVQSTLIYFVCAAVFLPMFGVHGLWAAMLIFFSARGATLCLRYPALERAAGEG